VSVVSRPSIIPRYIREGGGGPLEGEMEHEAREARPIGAQGAFASNSMHYTYTRALSPPISLWSPGYALANRETFASKRTHRSAPFDDFFALSSFDPRNLTREICRRSTPGDDEVTHPRLREGAHAISRNRCTGWRRLDIKNQRSFSACPRFFPEIRGLGTRLCRVSLLSFSSSPIL